jgi:hypothetical protein
MSLRFAIKSTASKAEKEGDLIIRFSGTSEPFSRVSERECKKVGVDGVGNPILSFLTGLDEKQVQFYNWYNEAEQAEVKKQIKELTKVIKDFYGGDDVINHQNRYFWLDNRNVSRLSITNETVDTFFDTKNPAHALLYLSVIGGAFIDLVAPTREWAERNQIYHFLVLETEDSYENDDEVTRSDAHAALSHLRKETTPEALFILAWCILYDTNAFGAINRSTPMRTLLNNHIQYIDGKLVTKKKRNTPAVFLEYADKWNAQQTRPALYVEAYIKAGEYFNYINQNEKKFVTADGTVLGNTISESVSTIMKPKFTADLEKLREQVETKWKE